jgi:sugar phosphate isomerase/epimerase
VEFWGYGGTLNVYQNYSAPQLRQFLDQSSLNCCGFHVELKALSPENIERTIENSRILGNEYLNVAAAEAKMHSEKTIYELADELNNAAAKCRAHKMSVGYHAHPFDFAKINGHFAWELLFSRTNPEVNMQMDVGNCLAGNGDPIAMLKEFPARTRTIHIKEHNEKTFDSGYYREVFSLCETSSGTQWYIVEMGGAEGDGFDVPRTALAKLRRLGK